MGSFCGTLALSNRGDFTRRRYAPIQNDTGNALDLKAVINFGIKRLSYLTAAFTAFGCRNRYPPVGSFAHQDIEAVSGDIGAQRAKITSSPDTVSPDAGY